MPSTTTDRLQGLTTSVAVKPPCKVASITNITLSGEQTVNSVAVVAGDRVLVTAQTSPVDNGIYVVSATVWARAADFDGTRDVVNGTDVLVGTTAATAQRWLATGNTDPIVIGTSQITFTQVDYQELALRADLADTTTSTKGDFLIGAKSPAAGAVGRTQHAINAERVSVQDFGADPTGVADSRAACQSAVDAVIAAGGGDVLFPAGVYLIDGAASDDTLLNGIVVPFQGFTVDLKVRLIGMGRAVLRAGDNDMVIVRASNPGTEVIGLDIDGVDRANGVWGIGLIAEDQTQTTTLVSQSFCRVVQCHIHDCEEGIVIEPGPTVLGAQSGAFYPVIDKCDLNFNTRSIWAKVSPHDATNRPTRGNISQCRIERGNCGVDLSYATEFVVMGCNFQFFNSTYTGPLATSSAIHIGTLSENNYIYGGNAEACDYDINNEATLPNALMIHGFALTGTNNNAGVLPTTQPHEMRITRRTAAYEQLAMTAHNASFARIVFDYGGANVKDVSVETNGSRRFGWFNGITTHYGSTTNWTWNAAGTQQLPSVDNVADIGSASFRVQRVYVNQLRIGDGTVLLQTGTGTPESSVTGPVGSLYLRLDGGASTTLYVKTSGTGNTGWTAK